MGSFLSMARALLLPLLIMICILARETIGCPSPKPKPKPKPKPRPPEDCEMKYEACDECEMKYEWSACNATCGWGSRTRPVMIHPAKYGGKSCKDKYNTERWKEIREFPPWHRYETYLVEDCNSGECGTPTEWTQWSTWSSWSSCSQSPGGQEDLSPSLLEPMTASLSSEPNPHRGADKCIDEIEKEDEYNFCLTKSESAPWIGIDYGATVNVQEVIIYRCGGGCGERIIDVTVRISDELPTSSKRMFSGGTLLGRFRGRSHETIRISGKPSCPPGFICDNAGESGKATVSGRYVVVQIDNRHRRDILELIEVKAYGTRNGIGKGLRQRTRDCRSGQIKVHPSVCAGKSREKG